MTLIEKIRGLCHRPLGISVCDTDRGEALKVDPRISLPSATLSLFRFGLRDTDHGKNKNQKPNLLITNASIISKSCLG